MNRLKMPNGEPEVINRRTDNVMAKLIRQKDEKPSKATRKYMFHYIKFYC